jgi:hypothetical protein
MFNKVKKELRIFRNIFSNLFVFGLLIRFVYKWNQSNLKDLLTKLIRLS